MITNPIELNHALDAHDMGLKKSTKFLSLARNHLELNPSTILTKILIIITIGDVPSDLLST